MTYLVFPVESKDNIPLAVAVIIFTVFVLSLGDAIIKQSSGNFVIWQIFVIRSLIVIPCVVLYLSIKERGRLCLPDALGWTILRSVLLVSMWISYYISLPNLTLSVAAAAYYTLPIFITLLSAVIIGDEINRTGWFAVFLGFVGVLLILRPSAGDFNWFALLPLLSAIFYALAMILTRTKCRAEHPIVLSLALNVSFVFIGGAATLFLTMLPDEMRQGFLLAPWAKMGFSQWISMSLLAVAILVGSVGAAIAYQNAPSSVIGIFDFSYVGFAVAWGVIFFADVPDVISVLGIGLIIGAGIMSLRQ
ncbi:MAG: EamA family transporter [Gammaproteobacteria bacterium]|nr:EamA family transporter [Gammaproteobacteria bacterium]